MKAPVIIRTKRCIVIEYQISDLPLYYSLVGDSRVMQHFPSERLLDDRERCREALLEQLQYYRDNPGLGVWKVCTRDGDYVGTANLNRPTLSATGLREGPIQIGYMLKPEYWGQGYATELAHAMLSIGFEQPGVDTLIAVTDQKNIASRRVMEKAGMQYAGISKLYYNSQLALYQAIKPD